MHTLKVKVSMMFVLVAMLLVYCVPVQSAEQIPPQVATESDRPGYSEVRFSAKGPVLLKVLQYFKDKGPTVGQAEVLCLDKREKLGWRVYYSFDLAYLQESDDTDLKWLASQIGQVRVVSCDQEFRMRGGAQKKTGLKKVGLLEDKTGGYLDSYLSGMSNLIGRLYQLDVLPDRLDLYCKPHVGEEDYRFGSIYPHILLSEGSNLLLEITRLAEAGYQLCEIEMPLLESI